MQCLEVIIDPDSGHFDNGPPSDIRAAVEFLAHEDDDEDVAFIFEEIENEEESRSSASSSMSHSSLAIIEHPYPTSHLFTDELEMLLTHVDGDDSDPGVAAISGPSAQSGRRLYRKSMSLPMSPAGGARERLDSYNFNEFLLSPLKMPLDVDPVSHFEDISMRNDFNLITYVGNDALPQQQLQKEPPVKVVAVQAPVISKKTAPKQVLSKGKCLDLLRATHERQENLVKRCVALDQQQQKRVTKNLFVTVTGNKLSSAKRGKAALKKQPAVDVSLKSDPNWSPSRDWEDHSAPKRGSVKAASQKSSSSTKEQKTNSGNSQAATTNCATTTNRTGAGSGNSSSNLNDIKRRFLANIPMVVAKSSSAVKRKAAEQKPQPVKLARFDLPVLPPVLDHNYCSPVKRSQPLAKVGTKPTKTAILIEKAPLKKDQKSPKKTLQVTSQPPAIKAVPSAVLVNPKRTINLEDYKKMRNQGQGNNTNTINPSLAVPKDYVDPISEAKEKALRMAERRKAARRKQDEIKLETPPLVPILPLAVMTGMISEEGYNAQLLQDENGVEVDPQKLLPFDEIMIVSVGCNTSVTIRPDYKSKALLSNLSNEMRAKNPITSNSLLFSIQDVVTKKSAPPPTFVAQKSPDTVQYSPGKPEGAKEGAVNNDHTGYHHGEDKIIMHLRKDRIRAKTCTGSCQTEITPEFPELKRLPVANKRHYRRRSRSTSRSSSSSGSSSSGSDSEYDRESRSSSVVSGDLYSGSEDEFGRAKRRRLYSNRSWSRSRSPSQNCRGSRSRYRSRSRSPRRNWSRASVSKSRSRSRSDSRPTTTIRNRNTNNNNPNRWRNINKSPGNFEGSVGE